MDLPEDLLRRSPEEAVRRIALGFLADADAAAIRLDEPEDAEALHDFRVAVRRLRSTLRAWSERLEGAARKKHRRALRRLQEATGGGRDAEVGLAWLAGERPQLHTSHHRGYDWLATRLRDRHVIAMEHAREGLREDYRRIRARLGQRLEVLTVVRHLLAPEERVSFGQALAPKARELARELARLLRVLEEGEDRDHCHRARITGKRLRYLLEPVRHRAAHAADVVRWCKGLQDILGDLNDAYVLRDELATAMEAAAEQTLRPDAQAGDELAGLHELTRRVQRRIEALFALLRAEWLGGNVDSLLAEVDLLAARLERGPGDLEIERKYLLSGLPDLPPEAEKLEVDQGWLPGERLRERVRRVQTHGKKAHFRTVKLGSGVTRVEIEEPTKEEVFEVLWPLTEHRRIRKRRYRVLHREHVWEIDEFLDRDLCLAEVELSSPLQEVPFPAWLGPRVLREVTEDGRYTNFELARSGGQTPRDD